MCCKDERGKDRVIIPLAPGHPPFEEGRVEFLLHGESPVTPEEAARTFLVWMRATVNGVFYDALRHELR